MINPIKKIFHRKPNYLAKTTQKDNSKTFILAYKHKEIGYLWFKEGFWFFKYSNWFINQSEIKPLVEFPHKTKTYESKELWSFFTSRIPSKMNSGYALSKLKDENLADLLEKFGKHTINNPFVLQ